MSFQRKLHFKSRNDVETRKFVKWHFVIEREKSHVFSYTGSGRNHDFLVKSQSAAGDLNGRVEGVDSPHRVLGFQISLFLLSSQFFLLIMTSMIF